MKVMGCEFWTVNMSNELRTLDTLKTTMVRRITDVQTYR